MSGIEEIQDMLEGLQSRMAQAARKGLQKGLAHTVAQAKALCPVDTGKLRDSITSGAEARGGQIEGKVTAAASYAASVELGSADTPPHPFLYPAYKLTRDRIVEEVKAAVSGQSKGG